MKNITIAGRCTRDAEVRKTQDGTPVAGVSVAVDDGFGQNKGTLFFDCSIWGARADKLAPMLTKGKQVTVSGDLGTRDHHNGKTYLTIRVVDVTLQGGGNRDQSSQDQGGGYDEGYGGPAAGGAGGIDDDDDIPF
jgi:single-strand DNA-binding protein